jgi:glyoxylase-like metal-dependent hydrolase (beta-lactamase superfamily II)
MEPLKLGRIELSQVIETLTPTSPRFLFPGITPEDFAPYLPWLAPHFYTPADDRFPMSIQTFIVRTAHHTIVVDTCVGNDKKRDNPLWHLQQRPFLAQLKAAGVTPEQVDFVLCTHLHVDHVGWNTRLVNGRWEPTFPNARYVFNRSECDFWSQASGEEQAETFRDSVLPILEAGRAVLVEGEHEITSGVVLEPTPGHTPGHCSVHLGSRGAEAVITGDLMHHPLQLLQPERCSRFAWDPALARTTRRAFLERYAERDVRIVGTHFAPPTHGRVVGHQDAFRLAL